MSRGNLRRRRAFRRTATGLSLAALFVCAAVIGAAQETADPGVATFALADFGGITRATLETNALPYKLVATALLMREEQARGITLSRADIPAVMRQFGFLTPQRVANWPGFDGHATERPLGLITRDVVGPTSLVHIDAVNLGCASCHSSTTFDSTGRPTPDVGWIGAPNTSLNLEAYAQAVYIALGAALRDGGAFRKRIESLFPEMGTRERYTLRWIVLPGATRRIRDLQRLGGPLAFPNGGPGRTNGVAAVKQVIGIPLSPVSGHADVGFSSTPELANRGLRSSLLYDGVYAPPGNTRFEEEFDTSKVTTAHLDSLAGIVAFFTVGTMGATPDVAERAIPAMTTAMQWIGKRYRSAPFPGRIDSTLMRTGADVFTHRCSNCHGTYGEGRPRALLTYPNALIEQSVIRTDSLRWAALDSSSIAIIDRTAYARHVASRESAGYVAPILSGAWSSAPYLHNGSVPSLEALLWPAKRPVRFFVGGHALDFRSVGIAGVLWSDSTFRYRPGYVPWSLPDLYDTRRPGLSSVGHESQFARLSDSEKWAVIEYLKTL